ncbi:MAG: nuclear transport factor 2 family protein [Polyangiales bacterium]
MPSLAELEQQLNRMLLDGHNDAAIERFYADDATLQENNEPPTVGKAAILARERGFVENVAESKPTVLHSFAVGDGVTFSEWTYDMTFKDGTRFVLHEIARRHWQDGKVVRERFYYAR